MTIGENIRRKRLEYDIEQQELAKRIGVTKGLISRIERDLQSPSVSVLVCIADTLHCSTDELLGRSVS